MFMLLLIRSVNCKFVDQILCGITIVITDLEELSILTIIVLLHPIDFPFCTSLTSARLLVD